MTDLTGVGVVPGALDGQSEAAPSVVWVEPVIGLMRGVNIGGRRVAMAAVRDGLAERGATEVRTLLQSGNVILLPPREAGPVGPWLETALSEIAGFTIGVVVRSGAEMREVVERSPYPEAGGARLHVVFAAEAIDPAPLEALDIHAFHPEHLTVRGREMYLHLPGGMGRSKLAAALQRSTLRTDPTATVRNWNTVTKLAATAAG